MMSNNAPWRPKQMPVDVGAGEHSKNFTGWTFGLNSFLMVACKLDVRKTKLEMMQGGDDRVVKQG